LAKNLTVKLIENAAAAPPGKRLEVADGMMPGLRLRITDKGAKSFVLLRTLPDGGRRRWTLGAFDPKAKDGEPGSLSQARAKAGEYIALLKDGRDPDAEREARREAEQEARRAVDRARQAEEQEQARRQRYTVANLAKEFLEAHIAESSSRHGPESAALFRRDVVAAWGNRHVSTIDRDDVRDLLKRLARANGPTAANRRQDMISKFFRWVLRVHDHRKSGFASNPAAELPKLKETPRDRLLTDAELAVIWRAAERMSGPYGRAVRLLILTAQRRSEVGNMLWAGVDQEARAWRLRAAETKAARESLVPLTDAAIEILLAQRAEIEAEAKARKQDPGPFLFSGNGGETPISGWSDFRHRLDLHIAAVVADDAAKGRKVEPPAEWRLHDLRRKATTGMAAAGTDRVTLAAILNHSDGTTVARHYDRYERWAEKLDALTRWSEHVKALVSGKPGAKVIRIPRKPGAAVTQRQRTGARHAV